MPRGPVIFALTWLTACTCCPCPSPDAAPDPLALLSVEFEGDEEARYAAIRAHRSDPRHGFNELRLTLLAVGAEPMIRNAAARTLLDRGSRDAAWHLILNLHRDQRTFVVTDAIYHLREVFGTDLGYEPNRGYRHQTEVQADWVEWFRQQPFGDDRPLVPPEPKPRPTEAERSAVARALTALRDTHDQSAEDESRVIMQLWQQVADGLASSRHPDDVRIVADVFGELARRRPRVPALWNNLALAQLNDGRYELAEASYRHALELAPDDAQLHNDVGILLEGLGRLPEAEAAYRAALRLRPEDDVATANLGDVLRKQGHDAEAIQAWRSAERIAPAKWQYHRLWIERLSR